MKTTAGNQTRRRILIASVAGVPALPVSLTRQAHAATLLRLAEDDPAASTLQYHRSASSAPRKDKAGTSAEEQFCYNCRFIQADDGEWRPCEIFSAKAVHEDGWCSAWMPKG
jgi:hypothetical protein